jgi:hypothetical protein
MTPRLLIPVFVPLVALAAILSGCESDGRDGPDRGYYSQGPGPDDRWEPSSHYRDGDYQERPVSRDERIYRGGDGRYYCRRSDGTAGLIVGGIAGGALGDAIAPGGSKTLGTVLGAIGGAAIGSSVDRDSVHCR